jgi:RNA polymerase sigma-B factor
MESISRWELILGAPVWRGFGFAHVRRDHRNEGIRGASARSGAAHAFAAAALAVVLVIVSRSSLGGEANRGGDGDSSLFQRSREGDRDARERVIERYLPLANRLARRYWYGREPLDDLLQVARVGLVKAVDRFDAERGMPFSAYAVPTILGELKRHFRDTGWALHVPQRVQARALQVEHATEDLRRRLGRTPSAREVAEATGVELREIVEAAEASAAADTVSLETAGSGEGHNESVADVLGSEDERYELVEWEASIAPALRALPARERVILHLRFVEDLTQFEIGAMMGISQMHVSRLLRRSLARLRAVANADAA